MGWLGRVRFFHKAVIGIFFTFMGLMVMVTAIAYSRQSGFTRQDMAEAHIIRAKATEKLIAERQKEAR